MSKLEKERDLAKAGLVLAQQHDGGEVSDVVVNEIRALLNGAKEQTKSRVITEDEIQNYLQALIEKTPLAGARIVPVEYEKLGVMDSYKSLSTIVGQYPLDGKQNGSFNVWVSRVEGAWVVNYSKVPNTGNLRASR